MKILVIQQKMIGDVLTSSILFEAIRKKYPAAELHYLIYRHTAAVVENNPFIDELILFDPNTDLKPAAFFRFLKSIKKQEYDVVIDVYSKINSAAIAKFSGAGMRISYDKWYTRKAYTHTFPYKRKNKTTAGLAIENRMQLLQALSEEFPLELKPKIYVDINKKQKAAARLKKGGISMEKPLIMCGVLGSSNNKSYPSIYLAFVLDAIVSQIKDCQIILNYVPFQEKQALEIYNLCCNSTKERIFLDLYAKELNEFIATCANSDMFIGNEGGAANISKALKIPTFSIHSPYIKKDYWGVYQNENDTVSVHLEDYFPALFKNKKEREIRHRNQEYYKLFKPELFRPSLETFLRCTQK